jgi:hypothetical protein
MRCSSTSTPTTGSTTSRRRMAARRCCTPSRGGSIPRSGAACCRASRCCCTGRTSCHEAPERQAADLPRPRRSRACCSGRSAPRSSRRSSRRSASPRSSRADPRQVPRRRPILVGGFGDITFDLTPYRLQIDPTSSPPPGPGETGDLPELYFSITTDQQSAGNFVEWRYDTTSAQTIAGVGFVREKTWTRANPDDPALRLGAARERRGR